MSILSSHAGSWHSDKWYRRAWSIRPQVASLLVVGWVFAGVLLKPVPWAQPQPPAKPAERTQPQPPASKPPQRDGDETTCSQANAPGALAACSRLIQANGLEFYFTRAKISFGMGDNDRPFEDL